MKYPETIRVEKLKERIEPEGGSGTGYCQYMKLKLYFDNGKDTTIAIADWCTSKEYQSAEAYKICWALPISNPTETLLMILDKL